MSAIAQLVAMALNQACQPPAHRADRQPVLQDEQIGRAEAEHDDRVAVEPIAEAGAIATAPGIRAPSAW